MTVSRYVRSTSFRDTQSLDPAAPLNGTSLDAELNAIQTSIGSVADTMALIQRSDGALANNSVGVDQLAASVLTGLNPPLPWVTATAYTTADTVTESNVLYRCIVAHTSGTFATDLAADKWVALADYSADVGPNSVGPTQLQANAVTTTKILDGSVTTDKLASLAVTTGKIAASAVTSAKIAAGALDNTDKFDAATLLAIRDIMCPLGTVLEFTLPTLPSGFLWCDGSPILVDTGYNVYRSALIAASYPYGQDGSGNPKTPDRRGRLGVGKDDMGGSAASRVTSGGSGVDGATLGASGGAETVTLTIGQMPAHDHGGSTSVTGNHAHNYGNLADNIAAGSGTEIKDAETGTDFQTSFAGDHSHTISSQGGGGAHNNMPPALVVNYIVRAA